DPGRAGGGTGVCIGSGRGGFASLERFSRDFIGGGPRAAGEDDWADAFGGGPAAAVARALRLRGPVLGPNAACATGAAAIAAGARMIATGMADAVLAGATESCLSPLLAAGYARMGVLAADACRPYDSERSGFILGEGCGVVVLEERAQAVARGARVRAVLLGWAEGCDGLSAAAPAPDGEALARVIAGAVRRAGIAPGDVGYVNTHGTGTRLNDPAETRAIRRAFGRAAGGLSLSSTKPATGHLLGAAGAVEFIIAVLAIERGVVPPTLNLRRPDPACDLDYTPLAARERPLGAAASVSCGFGGPLAVLVAGRGSP
ncbi:MAG: beta-ketoacyl-[acyl-carrier-protein] synthase family protein, partial [bacterium]|nr:beta-ketoacyl-[acyl-carrier-protein] synthase family protein [bacterium]